MSSEDVYWSEMASLKGTHEFFADQGDAHGEIDGNLQEAIEGLLVPLVGPWESSDVWFHNQDFFGDGVRQLTFRAGEFPWQVVVPLQNLLVGEAARFCIFVHFADTLGLNGQWVGTMGILEYEVVATPYVAEMLNQHVHA
ncbi:MAG: hypothetical protein HYX42_10385 [Polaromonas sp.]|uniref:hypothetical protein n=1 Tax=Polaromonas sp. TaxID=1869339 RepID=UPI0025E28419|nr:hypothetical protein [Polaromonas sp.]MBI2726644.1 hypothetical protein [Polaromonas sp.]